MSLPSKYSSARMVAKFQAKPCRRCGEIFEPRSGRAEYCDNCQVIAKREYDREWWQRKRKEEEK